MLKKKITLCTAAVIALYPLALAGRDYRSDDFVERMVRHLWEDLGPHCEAQGLWKGTLEPFVRRGMAAAAGYGLRSEGGIQQYLDCMVVLGPDFDHRKEHAWAGEILRNKDLGPGEKTEALAWQMLSEVDWEESPDG